MWKVVENTKDLVDGKLGSNWEGPYKIVKLTRKGAYHLEDSESKQVLRPYKLVKLTKKGAYHLEDSESKQVSRPLNSNNLKKYYH